MQGAKVVCTHCCPRMQLTKVGNYELMAKTSWLLSLTFYIENIFGLEYTFEQETKSYVNCVG